LGILYLDRTRGSQERHRGPFEQQDADFLHALAWVTRPALGASSRISDMQEWNRRLESIVSQRGGDRLFHGDSTTGVAVPDDDIGKLLRELETSLAGVGAGSQTSRRKSASDIRGWSRSLESILLRMKAVRRLCQRRSARLEEVQVALACREAVAKYGLPPTCVVVEGGDLAVLCAPDELFLAIQLAVDALVASRSGAGLPSECWAIGTSTPDGAAIRLRLSLKKPTAEEADTDVSVERTPTDLPLRLLQKWVRERIRGDVEASVNSEWVELQLPQASAALGETVAIAQSRPSTVDGRLPTN
jgi:hypothetical protein